MRGRRGEPAENENGKVILELARQVAAETGESLTEAIIHSLEERLERLKARRAAPDLAETLIAISRRCSSLPDLDTREADEILGYDETGA
jgi:antitoxin VapB